MNIETQDVKAGIRKISNSITVKILSIAFLILALLIPAQMIYSVIEDRETLHRQVIAEVSGKWGREQLLTGPVLSIPYQAGKPTEYAPCTCFRKNYLYPGHSSLNHEIGGFMRSSYIPQNSISTGRLHTPILPKFKSLSRISSGRISPCRWAFPI